MNNNIVDIYNLKKSFNGLLAVKNINLKIKSGEIFGILGPNGSGKSTLIRMLCGILKPDFGSGRVLNFDILKGSEQIKQNIGYMSQKFGLYEDLTVMENLNFYAQIYSIPKTERIRKINDVINISNLDSKKTQLTSTLSGGWKQRLALSCVLIHKPKLLILDEPTSAVDPVSRRIFWNIIHKLSSEGISIIVTTHYMDEAETCDKIAFVFDGEIIGLGSPNELIKNMNVYSLEDVFIKYVEKKCSDTIPH